eukprot:8122014-Karenia_brevis.AAC.1
MALKVTMIIPATNTNPSQDKCQKAQYPTAKKKIPPEVYRSGAQLYSEEMSLQNHLVVVDPIFY